MKIDINCDETTGRRILEIVNKLEPKDEGSFLKISTTQEK